MQNRIQMSDFIEEGVTATGSVEHFVKKKLSRSVFTFSCLCVKFQ